MKQKLLSRTDKTVYLTGWIFAAIGAALAISYLAAGIYLHLPPCMLHTLTGYYCPGCGGSRAVIALIHGHILWSFYYHPVVPIFVIFYVIYMVLTSLRLLSHGRIPMLRARSWFLWMILFVTIANCVIKNLVLVLGGIALL